MNVFKAPGLYLMLKSDWLIEMLIKGHILNGKITGLLNQTYPNDSQSVVGQYAEQLSPICIILWYFLVHFVSPGPKTKV